MKPTSYNPTHPDEWNFNDYYLWCIAESLNEILRELKEIKQYRDNVK